MATRVQGADSLLRKFAALSETVKAKQMERALVAGALPVQNAAKENAPWETGNLRRSIHIGGHEDLAEGGDIVDRSGEPVPRPELGGSVLAVYVGTDVNYAAPVEYGGGARRPHPYLRKAADEQKGAVRKEVGAAWRDLVRAAAR